MANLTTVVYSSGTIAGSTTGTVSTVDALLAAANTNGQSSMAGSTPVVIASNQSTIPVSVANTVAVTVPLGQSTMAASTPVVIASNQSAVSVTTGGATVTIAGAVTVSNTVAISGAAITVAATSSSVTIVQGGQSAVVKAASTAASAADSGLVVCISPNNPAKIWDGTNSVAVKAASTTAAATDTALVVALSPNGLNSNGQTSMAASAPVVIASNQSAVAVTVPLGQSSAAASTPVVIATNQSSIPVAGDVAASATNSGNPVFIGGIGKTTNPVGVSDNQRVGATFDKLGKQVVVGSIRVLKGSAYASVATGTETTIAAGVASTFLDVYGCVIANNSATATQISFKDSLSGTTRFAVYCPAGDTRGFMLPESAAFAQNTVNNAWTALCQPSVAAALITLMYVQNT